MKRTEGPAPGGPPIDGRLHGQSRVRNVIRAPYIDWPGQRVRLLVRTQVDVR